MTPMRLVVALDMPSLEENITLIHNIAHFPNHVRKDIWLKVGLRTFIRDGIKGIEAIKEVSGAHIFLDLKLYDIPKTMAEAAHSCAELGIDMLTIHASAGIKAMQYVMKAMEEVRAKRSRAPLIMGITALTSFSDDEFKGIYNKDISSSVLTLSQMCAQGGIDGVVCSVKEVQSIKQISKNLITLTPGIRPLTLDSIAADDQSRIATIEEAYTKGADFIVIGRPIYAAPSPKAALESIISQMKNAQESLARPFTPQETQNSKE